MTHKLLAVATVCLSVVSTSFIQRGLYGSSVCLTHQAGAGYLFSSCVLRLTLCL